MEEQSKKIEMNVEKNVAPKENQQPSYEELYKAYMDLAHKHQIAIKQLQQADKYIQTFNRLDYLFRVIEASNKNANFAFDSDFVNDCVKEIQELMTPPVDNTPKDDKEN